MTKTQFVSIALMAMTLSAGSAAARPPLKDVAYVRDGIITAGIAYEISQQCDDISARLFRGYNYLNSLKSHARGLGYTSAEIDAYTDDSAEKTRLEAIARSRLADMGAIAGQASTYCAVGRAEIAGETAIGRLLR